MTRGGSRDNVLPVMLPLPEVLRHREMLPVLRLRAWHGAVVVGFVLLTSIVADAATGSSRPGVLSVLVQWSPLLLQGFGFNLLISFLSMAIGTVVGVFLGLGLVSPRSSARAAAWSVTQFFRNAPWLVLIFFMILLLPFRVHIGPFSFILTGWLKAVIALALPVMANTAEIVRGGVRSIDPGQWQAAESLGFTRRQQLWGIILPQCTKRMIPPWMNLYAILTMATTLASIVGVNEVVTLAHQMLAAEGGRTDLLAPVYGYVLLLFFLYSYPIARFTLRLERQFAVRS